MTPQEAKKMLEAKLKCLIAETSGTNHDCNMRLCDECPLNYEQGNMGEQKQALDMAIKALEQTELNPSYNSIKPELKPCEDCISRQYLIERATSWDKHFADSERCVSLTEIQNAPSVTPKAEWIPVSERLPDKLNDVLIAFYDCPNEYDVAYLRTTFNELYKKSGAKNEWVSSMGETTYADYEVDAWMPIQPYKAESEIHCNCTDAEIAKSFIEDVEAVKELLPQAESEDKK